MKTGTVFLNLLNGEKELKNVETIEIKFIDKKVVLYCFCWGEKRNKKNFAYSRQSRLETKKYYLTIKSLIFTKSTHFKYKNSFHNHETKIDFHLRAILKKLYYWPIATLTIESGEVLASMLEEVEVLTDESMSTLDH